MTDHQRQTIRRRLGFEEYRAILGDAYGIVWDDPVNRPGMMRVRYATASGLSLPPLVRIGSTYQGNTAPGTGVLIGWEDGELRVLRPDINTQMAAGFNPALNNASVAARSQQATDSITMFKSHPTSPVSLYVVVRSWLYIESGTVKLFDASGDDGAGGFKGKINLSSYVPTTGNHRLACLFLKPDNTIEVKASTTQSVIEPLDLTDLQECFSAATDATKPCWAWRLADGQTTIGDESSWLDLRQFINVASGATVYYQTVQNNGSNMTQRPTLNLIQGEGIQLDVADSSGFNRTNVSISNVVSYVGTAGENVSANEAVYLNAADNKWYKIDIDAVAAVKVAKFRGFASSTAVADGIISTRLFGKMSNFSGLTGGLDVYASTTAGGITQTKPTVSAAGGQRAIVRLGFAIDTASIFILPSPVEFLKRESLSNGSALTIEHYSDPLGRERRVRAYISTTTGGTLTEYTSANHDQDQGLRAGTGGTLTITGSINSSSEIGNNGGSNRAAAQSFSPTAGGHLTQFTVTLTTSTGSPTGTMTWYIKTGSAGSGGTVLATGTFTPTASATNTINVSGGPFLNTATTYYLVLVSTSAQSTNNYWNWSADSANPYAAGDGFFSTDNGASFSSGSRDLFCAFTTVALDRIAQSFQIGSSDDCAYVTLYLKKVGTPAGTLTLRVETNSGSAPSGTLVDASATITVAESGLSTSYSNVTFNFTDFALSSGTTYWLVLSTDRSASDTNYVVWGVDASSPGYASGNLSTYASAAYTADANRDAVFSVMGPTTTYEEPCVIGRESGGTRDLSVRYDDGAGANADTKTTFTNRIGSSADITAVLELA